MIERIDALINSDRWAPRWGWHDDHRSKDRTDEYLPAIQQVRNEFVGLWDAASDLGVLRGRCLQLGLGACAASHCMWSDTFALGAVTIDAALCIREKNYPGLNTKEEAAVHFAAGCAPYSFLFIDAGHKMDDIWSDHQTYGPMVRRGGMIVFHDALKRPGYENEIDVWRYLETFKDEVHMIGDEVGVAWIRKE